MLERELARVSKSTSTITRSDGAKNDLFDELLVLDAAAVSADELHPGARQGDLEDPRVGRVGEVEAYHLSLLRGHR